MTPNPHTQTAPFLVEPRPYDAPPTCHQTMRVVENTGIEITVGQQTLHLDPRKETPDSVITHAHTDHLTPGGYMTPATEDFLRIRRPTRSGRRLHYHKNIELKGATIRLHDAGHILGSAMIEATTPDATLVYTGDFNPNGGLTTNPIKPVDCDILVMESTYGDPRFDLPPRGLVIDSLESWMLSRSAEGPVALGAYPLGRAQELIHLANRNGLTPIVNAEIGALTAVYNAHGHDLTYAISGTERAANLDGVGAIHIVGRQDLKKGAPFATTHRAKGGSAAYLSGWCHRYSYFRSYDIDAQFALSDHASFSELIDYVETVQPRTVYTMHGANIPLATQIRQRLMIKAEANTNEPPKKKTTQAK